MENGRTFSTHDKRVTLNLALHSNVVAADHKELKEALAKLPALDWDVYKLPQKDIELIYATFDDGLEETIREEFVADPDFLIDFYRDGTLPENCFCPLCGHEHIRWCFNIQNVAGGQDVKCGSVCILTHGLCVKGAETAEEARKALEAAIRRRMKKYEIEAWLKDHPEFPGAFGLVLAALKALRDIPAPNFTNTEEYTRWYNARYSAIRMTVRLRKLQKFYDRTGWLNTRIKWEEWRKIVGFARKVGELTSLSYPAPWESKAEKKAKAAEVSKSESHLPELPEATKEAIVKIAPESAQEPPETEPAVERSLEKITFAQLADELVWG